MYLIRNGPIKSVYQLLNVDQIGSWPRGVVKSTQMINRRTSFVINYNLIAVTSIIDSSERENYRWSSSKRRAAVCEMRTCKKYRIHNNSLQKDFHAFNFCGWGHPWKIFNNENFPIYGIIILVILLASNPFFVLVSRTIGVFCWERAESLIIKEGKWRHISWMRCFQRSPRNAYVQKPEYHLTLDI